MHLKTLQNYTRISAIHYAFMCSIAGVKVGGQLPPLVIFEGDSLKEGEESRNAGEEGMSREGPHEETGCKVEEDKVNVELKVEEGDVKLGGAGEECSSADKMKGRRRKKKVTHTKEMSHIEKATHTEGTFLTGEASHTEGASLTGDATHTEEEASLTGENTQSTEQISTDVQELMQACKVGDTQQLASLLNKMGLVSCDVQDTGAMNESKEEMNEAMKVDGVPMPGGNRGERTSGKC